MTIKNIIINKTNNVSVNSTCPLLFVNITFKQIQFIYNRGYLINLLKFMEIIININFIKKKVKKSKIVLILMVLIIIGSFFKLRFGNIQDSTSQPEFQPEKINLFNKNFYNNKLKDKLIEILKIEIPETNPKVINISSINKNEYEEKKILIETLESNSNPAYLLIPKNIEFPAPAIIVMHRNDGLYDYGKEEPVGNIGKSDKFYAKDLVKRGYIVLVMDSQFFGENTVVDFFNQKQKQEALELLSKKISPISLIIKDDLSSLNYLSSLDIVDKNNIGCIGHSFGGVRCMYLSALDQRIKAVVLSDSVANIESEIEETNHNNLFTTIPGISKYTETSGILSLIAPRNLMIIYSNNKDYPKEQALLQLQTIKKVYSKLFKVSNLVSLEIIEFNRNDKAYNFLDKNLKNN